MHATTEWSVSLRLDGIRERLRRRAPQELSSAVSCCAQRTDCAHPASRFAWSGAAEFGRSADERQRGEKDNSVPSAPHLRFQRVALLLERDGHVPRGIEAICRSRDATKCAAVTFNLSPECTQFLRMPFFKVENFSERNRRIGAWQERREQRLSERVSPARY